MPFCLVYVSLVERALRTPLFYGGATDTPSEPFKTLVFCLPDLNWYIRRMTFSLVYVSLVERDPWFWLVSKGVTLGFSLFSQGEARQVGGCPPEPPASFF